MKKIVMILLVGVMSLMFTGCFTDKAYAVGKKVYVGGKAAVEANADSLSDETLEKLKKIDVAATAYDKTRTKVRQATDTQPND